jgi:hypothetical protein
MKKNFFMHRKTIAGLMCSLLTLPATATNTTETVEQVQGTVTLSADVDYVVTSATPFADGAVVNITNTDNAVVILSKVKPAAVSRYFQNLQINGVKASSNNCMVKIYGDGSIILPHNSSIYPLTVYTANGCQGESARFAVGLRVSLDGNAMNNKICSFTLKRGYMAWFAQKADGTGYNRLWVADKGDIQIDLPGVLRKAVSALRVSQWNDASKKGYAGNDVTANTMLNTTWCYNWDAGINVWTDREYVTQHHHEGWPGITDVGNNGTSANILGNNEPDNTNDAKEQVKSVQEVLANWPQMMATGRRLGSPAVSGNYSWLYEFIDSIDARGWRCDFIAVHAYRYNDWSSWKSFLTGIYNRTHRPIWITEMNYGANWTGWPGSDTSYGDANEAILAQHLNPIIDGLEDTPWLERYAIYNWVQDCRKVYDNDHGRLTQAGEYYANKASAVGYSDRYVAVPPVKATMKDPDQLTVEYDKTNGTATLTWKDFNGENNYGIYIERKVDGGSWTQVAEVDQQEGSTDYTYTDTSAVGGAYYRVHVLDGKNKDRYTRSVAAVSLEHEVGDAITYKGQQRYLGGNVFVNGDFDLGTEGWTNGLGEPVALPDFTVVPVGSIDDGAYLQARSHAGKDKAGAVKTVVSVAPDADYYFMGSSRCSSSALIALNLSETGETGDSTAAVIVPTTAWGSVNYEVNTGRFDKVMFNCYYLSAAAQIDKIMFCRVFSTPEEAYADGIVQLLRRAELAADYVKANAALTSELRAAIAAATGTDADTYRNLKTVVDNVLEAYDQAATIEANVAEGRQIVAIMADGYEQVQQAIDAVSAATTAAETHAAARSLSEAMSESQTYTYADGKVYSPAFDEGTLNWTMKCGTYTAGEQKVAQLAGKSCWKAFWSGVDAAEGSAKTMEVKQDIAKLPHGLYALECKAATELLCLSDQHGYLIASSDTVATPLLTADYLDLPSVDNESKWQTLATPNVYVDEGQTVTIGFVGSKQNATDNAWREFGVKNSEGDKREGWWAATDFRLRYTPIYRRTAEEGEWSTVCLPYDMTPTPNVQLYQLAGITADYKNLVLEPVERGEAGVPYIYRMTGDEAWFHESGEAVTSAKVTSYQLRGNFKSSLTVRAGYYVMQNNEWVRVGSTNRPKLTNFGACLTTVTKLPVVDATSAVTIPITGADEEMATGIDGVTASDDDASAEYAVDGREVNPNANGLHIVKGKYSVRKVVRK